MFKVFEKRRQQCDNVPTISIAPWGKFAFNKTASDWLKLNNFKKVVLLFDQEKSKIGIRQPIGYDESEYKLSNSQHETYLVFSSIAFLKYIKYPLKQTKSFLLEWDEQEKMYIVILPPLWS